MKVQRNDKCPCGSGKKYKKCCLLDKAKDAEISRAATMDPTPEDIIERRAEPMKVYQLKVTLVRMGFDELEEEASRTFEVEGDTTLFDFHLLIQEAFDWDNDHMFSFYFGGKLFDPRNEYSANPLGQHTESVFGLPSKSAVTAQIRDFGFAENSTFLYLFDYGDELVHVVKVEKIREKSSDDINLPIILTEVGESPPQYREYEEYPL